MSSRCSSSSSSVDTVIFALERSAASWPTSNRSITQSPPYSRTSSRTRDRMPVSIRCPVISTVSLACTGSPSRMIGGPDGRDERQRRGPAKDCGRATAATTESLDDRPVVPAVAFVAGHGGDQEHETSDERHDESQHEPGGILQAEDHGGEHHQRRAEQTTPGKAPCGSAPWHGRRLRRDEVLLVLAAFASFFGQRGLERFEIATVEEVAFYGLRDDRCRVDGRSLSELRALAVVLHDRPPGRLLVEGQLRLGAPVGRPLARVVAAVVGLRHGPVTRRMKWTDSSKIVGASLSSVATW